MDDLTLEEKHNLVLSFPGKLSEVRNFPSERMRTPSSAVYEMRSADRTTWETQATCHCYSHIPQVQKNKNRKRIGSVVAAVGPALVSRTAYDLITVKILRSTDNNKTSPLSKNPWHPWPPQRRGSLPLAPCLSSRIQLPCGEAPLVSTKVSSPIASGQPWHYRKFCSLRPVYMLHKHTNIASKDESKSTRTIYGNMSLRTRTLDILQCKRDKCNASINGD